MHKNPVHYQNESKQEWKMQNTNIQAIENETTFMSVKSKS